MASVSVIGDRENVYAERKEPRLSTNYRDCIELILVVAR
jgi:hypothetical protein